VDAAGRRSKLQYQLLPAHILLVADLDATNLQHALRRLNGPWRNTQLQFRVMPMGRFDAALIPVGRVGAQPDRFLLAVEQGLSTQDQVALYGHAVGHLLLNYQEEQLGRTPQLDPRNGYAHADTLAELRLLEAVKQTLDRRVLETYPLLTRLLYSSQAHGSRPARQEGEYTGQVVIAGSFSACLGWRYFNPTRQADPVATPYWRGQPGASVSFHPDRASHAI